MMIITAGPITKLFACGEGDSGGHVLVFSTRGTLQQQLRCAPHGLLGERDTASGQGTLSR
jgi:hypothetical protein